MSATNMFLGLALIALAAVAIEALRVLDRCSRRYDLAARRMVELESAAEAERRALARVPLLERQVAEAMRANETWQAWYAELQRLNATAAAATEPARDDLSELIEATAENAGSPAATTIEPVSEAEAAPVLASVTRESP